MTKLSKQIVPPIKSQGIKTKLIPWINSIVPDIKGSWIEPFLGTGAVAFNSNFTNAVVGDINPHIINFYTQIQNGYITPDIVREYLEHEGVMLKNAGDSGYVYFREVRDRFNNTFHPLDFLFLSRAGFNGMMRFNKKGKWNVPFCKKPDRFSKSYVTKIVNQVAAVQSVITPNWSFKCGPFEDILEKATSSDIIYCDPPYIGRYVDYYGGWTVDNENKLCELLTKTPAKFILSTWHHNDYRENPYIKSLWSNFNIVTMDHFYHSGGKIENRGPMVEALIFNFDIDKKDK